MPGSDGHGEIRPCIFSPSGLVDSSRGRAIGLSRASRRGGPCTSRAGGPGGGIVAGFVGEAGSAQALAQQVPNRRRTAYRPTAAELAEIQARKLTELAGALEGACGGRSAKGRGLATRSPTSRSASKAAERVVRLDEFREAKDVPRTSRCSPGSGAGQSPAEAGPPGPSRGRGRGPGLSLEGGRLGPALRGGRPGRARGGRPAPARRGPPRSRREADRGPVLRRPRRQARAECRPCRGWSSTSSAGAT